MNPKKTKKIAIQLISYLFISTGLTFILLKSIEIKTEWLFWSYFGVMAISSIIIRWHGSSDKENKFIQIMKHISYICTFTLLLLYFAIKYLDF